MTNIGITKYKRWIRLNLSVTNSPFTEGQAKQINELLHTLSPNQQVWLSGYLMANQQCKKQRTNELEKTKKNHKKLQKAIKK